ncbi:MAG: methyltransferase domain-containing protein [Proteobacteria bacterium]|nr:methyltransferase domain-containing protein [Pseudomonadota bacterium]
MVQEILFDRNLLRENKKRALKNFPQACFLHREIANRIAENVELLNRDFTDILEIGAMDDYLRSIIRGVNYQFYDDEENLLLQSESFDLILSNLNFHYINQIPQFLLQIKNALKPNGVFIASFFGEENLHELAHVLYETENEIYSGVSPRMPPTIDVKTAANLLAKAGFRDSISDFEKIEVKYSNPLSLLKDLKMMGQGNIMNKRSRKFFTKNFLNKILENYRKMYATNDNGILATFEIVTITGFKAK